jgi:hypothetical protein
LLLLEQQIFVFPLDHEPFLCEWTAEESNPDYLGANQASYR